MTDLPPPEEAGARPPELFELGVITDRAAYTAGDVVRLSVVVTNTSARFVEQTWRPGWLRVDVSVRDERHRAVAMAVADRAPTAEPFTDRWAPGQTAIFPLYWSQHQGPIVPAWSTQPAGPRVAPGRYRARAEWRGTAPAGMVDVPDAWSSWFDLV